MDGVIRRSYLQSLLVAMICASYGREMGDMTNNTLATDSVTENQLNILLRNHPMATQPPHFSEPLARRQYKFEDFFWTGSGDGPILANSDGGLAWEDNGPAISADGTFIKVTKTRILYKTVMTTIYPVGMTPTVIYSPIVPTPQLPFSSPILTTSSSLSSISITIEPTPTTTSLTHIVPESTIHIGWPTENKTEFPAVSEEMMASASDPLYWVQTIIKANDTDMSPEPMFQSNMQQRLARVYAFAFKRHLLTSLGVINSTNEQLGLLHKSEEQNARQRRFSHQDHDNHELEWEFLGHQYTSSRLQQLALATMDVSVSIINITKEDADSVSMKYVVFAEGSPVIGSAAVKDLRFVSSEEMNQEIGYEVLRKAEALVQPPERKTPITGSSPWLIVAITMICLMVVLMLIIMFMVWKWKHNRLGDSVPLGRPQSGIQGGVSNPAFLGPMSHTERGFHHKDTLEAKSSMKPIRLDSDRRSSASSGSSKDEKDSFLKSLDDSPQSHDTTSSQKRLATDLENTLDLGPRHDMIKSEAQSSKSSRIPRARTKTVDQIVTSPSRKPKPRIPRSKHRSQTPSPKKTIKSRKSALSKEPQGEDSSQKSADDKYYELPLPPTPSSQDELKSGSGSFGKKTDQISYGNLDVCPEEIAKTPSDNARKLMGTRPKSSGPKRRKNLMGGMKLPETIDEISDIQSGESSSHEQDRDLSEKSFETSVEAGVKKDAQVQTPTKDVGTQLKRQYGRSKPKEISTRKISETKETPDVTVSTESEEIVEIHHIDSSSADSNPLGRMRRRFHQFLDDAFNVMATGKKSADEEEGRAQSAKVSISHQIETKDPIRPWTTQLIREQTLHKHRPKSASGMGPPKRAWVSGPDRRVKSASSDIESKTCARDHHDDIVDTDEDAGDEEECDLTSNFYSTGQSSTKEHSTSVWDSHEHVIPGLRRPSAGSSCSSAQIFPNYPVYPDFPMQDYQGPHNTLRVSAPAVPIIEAIKEEIKKYEKKDEPKY